MPMKNHKVKLAKMLKQNSNKENIEDTLELSDNVTYTESNTVPDTAQGAGPHSGPGTAPGTGPGTAPGTGPGTDLMT